MTYGRQLITSAGGRPVRVSADGSPEYKPGGVTIDWATVDAATEDTTLDDGITVPSGSKYLALGTVVAEIESGDSAGYYGPYDSGASDGREDLERGACYILDESVLQNGALGVAGLTGPTNHPAVIEGGLVWRARLRIGEAGQPSVADFEDAFPRIRYAQV